ncbi:MAG: alkaline phosphatase family protein [Sphingomicrobium sp.]
MISIDQLSSDLFDQYRPLFSGGLARLARGTVFRNGYQSHAASETCPGHSTILTGVRPAGNGIVANLWIDQKTARPDKSVYCAEDETVAGSTSTAYTVASVHLRVPTLGDLLKQGSPRSRVVAVAGKDRSAVMMTGRRPDQRWYWSSKGFVSDLPGAASGAAQRTNAAVSTLIAAPQPPLDPPTACAARATPIAVEGGGQPVGNGRFARAAGNTAGFRASPAFDGAVLALAAALVGDLRLGADKAPDILALGLAGTDYVGHTYGLGGQEMCLQLLSLDRDLGDFFRLLDRAGIDYAVALTADHGGLDIPERLRANGVADAARVDPELAATRVGRGIGDQLGLTGKILHGDFAGDVWLDRALKPADRARVSAAAIARYRAHPQVEGVFTAKEIAATPIATTTPDRWTMAERLRASFDPARSGDLLVVLKRNITPIVDTRAYISTHGSLWDYDRRVPILLWRPAMQHSEREQPIETVDIMPTLAAMLGLTSKPLKVDGKCLLGIQGVACPPR